MTVEWLMLLGNEWAACNHEHFYLDWHAGLSHNEKRFNVVENLHKWWQNNGLCFNEIVTQNLIYWEKKVNYNKIKKETWLLLLFFLGPV